MWLWGPPRHPLVPAAYSSGPRPLGVPGVAGPALAAPVSRASRPAKLADWPAEVGRIFRLALEADASGDGCDELDDIQRACEYMLGSEHARVIAAEFEASQPEENDDDE